MDILFDNVPSLDLADFTSNDAQKKAEFVRKLGEAYNSIGFVAIKNHGLSDALTEKLYADVKAFFALSIFTLCEYSIGVLPVALINLLSKFLLPTLNL